MTSSRYRHSTATPAPFLKNIKENEYKDDLQENLKRKRKKPNKTERRLNREHRAVKFQAAVTKYPKTECIFP